MDPAKSCDWRYGHPGQASVPAGPSSHPCLKEDVMVSAIVVQKCKPMLQTLPVREKKQQTTVTVLYRENGTSV